MSALTSPPPDADLISIKEACDRWQVNHTTIRTWIRTGRIEAYRLGPKLIRINPASLSIERLGAGAAA